MILRKKFTTSGVFDIPSCGVRDIRECPDQPTASIVSFILKTVFSLKAMSDLSCTLLSKVYLCSKVLILLHLNVVLQYNVSPKPK